MALLDQRRCASLDEACERLAADLAACLGAAIAARGRASLAVSGGRTPELVFPLLKRADLAWSDITVTLTDERWVAADDAASNEGLARRLLMTGPAAAASMVGLKTPAPSPEEGLAAADARLERVPWPLDAVFAEFCVGK